MPLHQVCCNVCSGKALHGLPKKPMDTRSRLNALLSDNQCPRKNKWPSNTSCPPFVKMMTRFITIIMRS